MMVNKALIRVLISGVILFSYSSAGEYQKLAQTGFQFLSVISDARAAGMAGAMTTIEMGSSSLFFNPAGLAQLAHSIDVTASSNRWLAGIDHTNFSLAFNPFNNRYGVVGISVQAVDYGEIQGTQEWGNDKGYIDTEIFNPTAYAAGIGYAKALSDMFSVGGQLKITDQHLGDFVVETERSDSLKMKHYEEKAIAFDFGTIFKTGFKSIIFGMAIRNFSNEVKYEESGFQLPLTFSLGLSADLFDFLPSLKFGSHLYCSIDAVHARSYPEYFNLGFEYQLTDLLAFRYGYLHNRDERSYSFGFGVNVFGAVFDYSYTPFPSPIFDDIQRFTIRFAL
ncbi:MAG: PorV/PorQ family protein [Candidatus Neomarinimicrobiota bacterium]